MWNLAVFFFLRVATEGFVLGVLAYEYPSEGKGIVAKLRVFDLASPVADECIPSLAVSGVRKRWHFSP